MTEAKKTKICWPGRGILWQHPCVAHLYRQMQCAAKTACNHKKRVKQLMASP